MDVQVYVEQAAGAFELKFLSTVFTNVYFNNSNVVYKLTPKGVDSKTTKGVLLNAHFDNSPGSPGASDCASCVGVLMEMASNLVHGAQYRAAAPIIMLFNGGEETLFQGAHAFVTHSEVPLSEVGAFINLESSGPGGYDTMIQHKGAWTAEAYGRSAKTPKASIWAQDQLALGVIPGSTDFVIFAQHLPGVDIAFMMDAGAYHTSADTADRIKPGTLQAMGDNAAAAALEFAKVLAQDETGAKATANDTSVFFDFYSHFMVTYPLDLALLLHNVPLLLALTLPLMTSYTPVPGTKSTSVVQQYWLVAQAFGVSISSWLMACAAAGGVGALRAAVYGRPLSWYGNHPATCLLFFPVAILGSMLPYMMATELPYCAVHTAYAVLAGLMSSGMTQLNLGGGFAFAMSSAAACVTATIDPKGSFSSMKSFCIAWLTNLPALSLSLSVAVPGIMHVIEKVTFIGSAPPPWTLFSHDLGVGLLLGLALFFHIAFLLPYFVHNSRAVWKYLLPLLLLTSMVTASRISQQSHFYTARLPKRVWMNAISEVDPTTQRTTAKLVLNAWDMISPRIVLPEKFAAHEGLPLNGGETLSTFFVKDVFRSHAIPWDWQPPADQISAPISLDSVDDIGEGLERLRFTLYFAACEHMVINMSGPTILEWSITEPPPKAQPLGGSSGSSYLLWLSSTQHQPHWEFWMTVQGRTQNTPLRMEFSRTFQSPPDSPQSQLAQGMPHWVSVLLFDSTLSVETF